MNHVNRALIILASYDFESLQLTLKSLPHTVAEHERIVVILNGINTLASAIVERVARAWAAESPGNRFVVRPICSGAKAFFAIKEVLADYAPLQEVEWICKIDDDVIPLKKNWLDGLHNAYVEHSAHSKVAFTTGLINNNCWGFNELLDIFDKRKDFTAMFNYRLRGGAVNDFMPGEVNNGSFGTIWHEPYIAWWVHQWTTLNIGDFIARTSGLAPRQIARNTGYSIGCIFFERKFWLGLNHEQFNSILDEEIIHQTCQAEGRARWAVMDQPMLHLFYFNQRLANRDIIDPVAASLSGYFNDESFKAISRITMEELTINLKEEFKTLHDDLWAFLRSLVADTESSAVTQ
ncbi:MAG TPA: hypothetical protein VFS25_16695 [Chitinophaga sp.]|uniref:hypothetical protein n=1 Tax=Chitinophaga sp. TaxID=1869181 RepID=UPI002DB681C5|nr:hypothetical protein [Chitinophaga sp.]HEU4554487.1 hypothetical protein [Chitinophaga sp.]